MALYMQQWMETRCFDIVIEAESLKEAEETFDRLDHSTKACKRLGCYGDFIWKVAMDVDSELECNGVVEADKWYTQPDLTADEIKQFLGE